MALRKTAPKAPNDNLNETQNGKLLRIGVTIEGVTALICNRFNDTAQAASSRGTRSSAAAQDRGTPLEVAQGKLYYGKDQKTLIIPQPNLLRCIVDGGKFHKVGKSQLTTATGSLMYSCVDILELEIPLLHDEPWRVDSRPVVIPSTKGRIVMHRPMFDDWQLSFTIELDTSLLNVKLLRDVVDDAGKRIGLGDFRPARKGPYGRFVVSRWQVQNTSIPLAAE